MVVKKYPPTIWCNDEIYTIYVEFLDSKLTPMEQVFLSIATLNQQADKHNIDVGQIFSKLSHSEVLHLLRVRKLSPWLLLRSRSFKEFIQSSTPEQQLLFDAFIRYEYWSTVMAEHPAELEDIRRLVLELGI
jgi:hypothetical protein